MDHVILHQQPFQERIYTLEEIAKRNKIRRRRVALRMRKRFPLFAVEFMSDEFKDYTLDQFELDVIRKRKPKKKKGKSQLKKQGRYELYAKAMADYKITKDQEYLYKAQKIRNKLFSQYIIEYKLKGKRRTFYYPSTVHYKIILKLIQIKFKTWDELNTQIEEKTRYINCS